MRISCRSADRVQQCWGKAFCSSLSVSLQLGSAVYLPSNSWSPFLQPSTRLGGPEPFLGICWLGLRPLGLTSVCPLISSFEYLCDVCRFQALIRDWAGMLLSDREDIMKHWTFISVPCSTGPQKWQTKHWSPSSNVRLSQNLMPYQTLQEVHITGPVFFH